MQFPIALAIMEYGILLTIRKYRPTGQKEVKHEKFVDLCTFMISASYIIVFNGIYWYWSIIINQPFLEAII